jgi:hypothetical protein
MLPFVNRLLGAPGILRDSLGNFGKRAVVRPMAAVRGQRQAVLMRQISDCTGL